MRTFNQKEPIEARHVQDICMQEHPWAITFEHPEHNYDDPTLNWWACCGKPELAHCSACS